MKKKTQTQSKRHAERSGELTGEAEHALGAGDDGDHDDDNDDDGDNDDGDHGSGPCNCGAVNQRAGVYTTCSRSVV